MKKAFSFNTFLLIFGVLAVPVSSQAASLLEIYQQALQSDPRIHEAEARRLAALEAEPQARGVLLPQIDFSGNWTSGDDDGVSTQPQFVPRDPNDPNSELVLTTIPFNRVTRDDTTTWQFQLRQTLFRWDQIVGLRRADKLVAKAEADREAAQQDLVVRVAQTYFDVLAAEDRLTSTHANRQAIARQLEQAKQRFEVGLIAITDVQESQAAYDQAVADEIQAKRDLATRREFLREITGEYVSALSAPGDEFPMRTPNPSSEKDWVDLALSQNLLLVSSRLDEKLARDDISFRRNGHYPTIDLVATTSDYDSDSDLLIPDPNDLTGISEIFAPTDTTNRRDSISIQFSVPLFSGGTTSSRVREAVYLHRAALEQLQRVTRETERQTRDAYLGVLSEKSRVEALQQAVKSSRTALEATQAGFEVGTRTIVDVLDSQFALYRSITLFYQARYDYLMNVLRLKQAAGTLQIQDLEEIDQWLKERKTPEQVFAEEAATSSS
ncbi:MAG: TolC family outer membrane protein [Gammaproteobacteria bacterium]|nr:TolC family outer membrane protein [Gammaproteobacteria bacterium]MDH3373354.1 TolC family outer membrane protein [Gammaproteobacteria bacterium]MDH3408386.1 TolC family outer membrane protein [Gammaproteobacteria bacterium]MDH3553096.1 TolC family outer membrane protein [Gammaproteobacteria bacterium]